MDNSVWSGDYVWEYKKIVKISSVGFLKEIPLQRANCVDKLYYFQPKSLLEVKFH